jgi:hypothetical protein
MLLPLTRENKQIFNLDSLPYGTDPTKVVFTASTKNSGVVFVKSLTSDSVSYYSSDSIDFTKTENHRGLQFFREGV